MSVTRTAAEKIAVSRQQLSSFAQAVGDVRGPSCAAVSGRPSALSNLNDLLLSTESQRLTAGSRTAALSAYDKTFAGVCQYMPGMEIHGVRI